MLETPQTQAAPRPHPVRIDAFTAEKPRPLSKEDRHPWWQVMCLSGVDYFSTLGYQPGIAVVAAGSLAPVATVVLVLVTMLGAVPVYRRIARASPNGQGSIAVLGRFVPGWKGKLLVLVLLGFAATDFMITMTLSAADASAHVLRSADSPWLVPVTLGLLGALCAVFFRGFREAVKVSVVLVTVYLALNAVIIGRGLWRLATEDGHVADWQESLTSTHQSPWMMLALAVIVFPKLALGLSGFETGVSVMPLIRAARPGHSFTPEELRQRRIALGRRLVLVSASVMSTYLVCSSVVVTTLIPRELLEHGGPADGRALAWLAHEQFGGIFGTVYDVSSIAILWFAGASAMAGLLALIPRYLPRYGMAPEWARRSRPMVAVLGVIAVLVTLAFRADVDAQSGAYATGVLVLLTSGGVAVTILAHREGRRGARLGFGVVTVVLLFTLGTNIVERPEGVRVAGCFIAGIIVSSAVSRALRSLELRGQGISYDRAAANILRGATSGANDVALVAHAKPAAADHTDPQSVESCELSYSFKENRVRTANHLGDRPVIFLEIVVRDASGFSEPLAVTGHQVAGIPVLRVEATAVPNAVAAVALDIRETSGVVPDLYFEWAPGSPVRDMIRFLAIGRGQNAMVTQEILRRAEPREERRPRVHVG
ncbi:hypothetical protein CBOVI_02285 [Corynebacterium bovis DSM 20582 = CIP 54.80]|nr:hypothetical protein CBOVI_02285 [Corynebacterium bovis DSM 20582 = CIP 54.80]